MIRSSACQPWQPDLPGHAGDHGDPAQLHHATGHDPRRSILSVAPVTSSNARFVRRGAGSYATLGFTCRRTGLVVAERPHQSLLLPVEVRSSQPPMLSAPTVASGLAAARSSDGVPLAP